MAQHIIAIESEAATLDRERAAALPTLEVVIGAARSALKDRYDDLRWCGKDDDCRVKAEGVSVAIEDFEQAVRAAIAQEGSPVGLDALREAFIEALVGAWGQAHYISARLDQNGVALVSNIEAAFGPLIPDWQEAAAEAARRAALGLSDDVSPGPEVSHDD
jgi:hypothetical protein